MNNTKIATVGQWILPQMILLLLHLCNLPHTFCPVLRYTSISSALSRSNRRNANSIPVETHITAA